MSNRFPSKTVCVSKKKSTACDNSFYSVKEKKQCLKKKVFLKEVKKINKLWCLFHSNNVSGFTLRYIAATNQECLSHFLSFIMFSSSLSRRRRRRRKATSAANVRP